MPAVALRITGTCAPNAVLYSVVFCDAVVVASILLAWAAEAVQKSPPTATRTGEQAEDQ